MKYFDNLVQDACELLLYLRNDKCFQEAVIIEIFKIFSEPADFPHHKVWFLSMTRCYLKKGQLIKKLLENNRLPPVPQ